MRQDSGIGVLDKAVGVLHAVAESPCGLADLCERTGDMLVVGGARIEIGYVEAVDADAPVPEKWRETIDRVLRQRLSAHEHPEALADALRAVPRSRPFEAWDDLAAIDAPTVVVASRDEVDPEHPYATGERYARAIPGARLVSEPPGASPLAWQGAQVSRVISEVTQQAATAP